MASPVAIRKLMVLGTESNSSVDWGSVVTKVKNGDPAGLDELQRLFYSGIRFYIGRMLGHQQLEASVQKTFTLLIRSIKAGDLHEHETLVGLVRTSVLEVLASYNAGDVQDPDNKNDLDTNVNDAKNVAFMVTALKTMSLRIREAFDRYYVEQQTQEQICEEMKLSEKQFLLMKAIVKTGLAQGGYPS